jgi:hypothetical protein
MATDVPIVVSDEIARPCDVPKHGERRLVRLLPTPFGSRPAIWTSPYKVPTVLQVGAPPEQCRVCVLLMSAGSPDTRPDVVCVTIPDAAISKFPLVPVEW